MTVTYYHNPNCSTSRNALALLREHGVEPTIVEYLKTPLTRTELAELLRRLDLPPRALIRTRGDLYAELGLAADTWSDEALLDMLAAHPALMERPVAVSAKGARIGRPMERVLEIL
jgi:arsenate reductase